MAAMMESSWSWLAAVAVAARVSGISSSLATLTEAGVSVRSVGAGWRESGGGPDGIKVERRSRSLAPRKLSAENQSCGGGRGADCARPPPRKKELEGRRGVGQMLPWSRYPYYEVNTSISARGSRTKRRPNQLRAANKNGRVRRRTQARQLLPSLIQAGRKEMAEKEEGLRCRPD